MKTLMRIGFALFLGFIISISVSLTNGQNLQTSVIHSLIFALIVGEIVTSISWGIDDAIKKGYSSWLGFFLTFLLNIFGLFIIYLLPNINQQIQKPVSK